MKQNVSTLYPSHSYSPAEIARFVRHCFNETVGTLHMTLRHPRSLARNTASWRPPIIHLPALPGEDALNVTITRRRVGPNAQARLQGFGQRKAAYLLSLRITSPQGYYVHPNIAEGWILAAIGAEFAHCVHVVNTGNIVTFLWLVDGGFTPLESPASLFEGFEEAA